MRLWSVPPLLLALLWALASVATVRAADDPGALFLQAYQAFQDGSKFEVAGKPEEALQKFRFCVSLLEQIQKSNPDFESIVIDFRLKKSRAAIERVQSLQSPSGSAVPVELPYEKPSSAGGVPGFPSFSVQYRIPTPGGASAAPPQSAPPTGGRGRDATGALGEQIRALHRELAGLRQENRDLNEDLLEAKAREQSALVEVDRTRVRVVELQSRLTQAYQTLDDLQQANASLSGDKDSGLGEIARLQTDLEAARADLEVSEEYNTELFAKLEQAASFIEANEKIRLQLLDEREQLVGTLKTRASGEQLAQAVQQRDAALAEKEVLQKELSASREIAERNKALATQLDAAEKQVAGLSRNAAERGKVEEALRGEAEAAAKDLAALREEFDAGRLRITELEKQLADTASATAGVTGAMAEENALLKSLVERQLEDQARRQQARRLVEEELEKLQVRSTTLLETLGAMAGAEPVLTPQESKLLDRPVTAAVAGVSEFELEIVKKTPESDLPANLVRRAAEANELSQKRRFAEARAMYEEIASKAPQSYLAAVNLGIAQRQLGEYAAAGAAFRRALALKAADPFALTNLGTVEYRSGNLAEAVKVLRQAVAADEGGYVAHYLLAVALNDQGDQESARREVRRSLALKSDYVPAIELSAELDEEIEGKADENSSSRAAQ